MSHQDRPTVQTYEESLQLVIAKRETLQRLACEVLASEENSAAEVGRALAEAVLRYLDFGKKEA